MSLKINNPNSSALTNLNAAQSKLQSSFAKLSSGIRINKASDDAAGLAIADALKSDTVSLGQGSRNASDGMSLLEIRDSTLQQVGDINTRLKELAVESANGTLSDSQRSALSQEFNALKEEAGRIVSSTSFNGQSVFSGEGTSIQVGTGGGGDSQINTGGNDISAALGSLSNLDISTREGAQAAMSGIDSAQSKVADLRSKAGAASSRLESAISNNEVAAENIRAAESRIRDLDTAVETANMLRYSILTESATAMNAQAKSGSLIALQLLK